MAIKDRISGIFKRNPKKTLPPAPDSAELTPTPASEEERQELLQHLGEGFSSVGQVLERLDGHLDASIRSLEGMTQTQNRLPGMLEGQRELIERTNDVAAGQAEALNALTSYLKERDNVQSSLVNKLEQIEQGLHSLRDHDRSQLDLLLQFQRSGRRMTLVAGLFGALTIVALLALLIVVSLRPDLLGLPDRSAAVAPTPPVQTPVIYQLPATSEQPMQPSPQPEQVTVPAATSKSASAPAKTETKEVSPAGQSTHSDTESDEPAPLP